MNKLRLVVVGAGHLGRIHARLAAASDELDLVAVVDPVESARQAVAAETDVPTASCLQDVVDPVDAVILATPTVTHHALGMELLERGLPLLIEKPLAATRAEADDLVQKAHDRRVVLQVGHVERFNPALAVARDELRDPKFIEATRCSGYSFRSTDIGVVLDMMIHDIDVILSLVNSPLAQVDALGISVLGAHEDMANARLAFESGCVAQLTASRVSFEMRRQMQIFTGRSFTAIDFATGTYTHVKPREDVLRREFQCDKLAASDVAYWKQHMFDELLVKSDRQPSSINAIAAEQRDFVASVRDGRPPQVDGAAGRDAVAVAELILQRIDQHGWDGVTPGRTGAHAMPALPILSGPGSWQPADQPQRRAG